MISIVCIGLVDVYAFSKWFVSFEAFVARIADKKIPGSFMTALYSVSNLANEWHKPLVLYAVDVFPYIYLVIFGMVYSLTFLFLTKRWLY